MTSADGAKRKFDGVVDSVPSDNGCEVLDGELTLELMNDGVEVTVNILLTMIMATFC